MCRARRAAKQRKEDGGDEAERKDLDERPGVTAEREAERGSSANATESLTLSDLGRCIIAGPGGLGGLGSRGRSAGARRVHRRPKWNSRIASGRARAVIAETSGAGNKRRLNLAMTEANEPSKYARMQSSEARAAAKKVFAFGCAFYQMRRLLPAFHRFALVVNRIFAPRRQWRALFVIFGAITSVPRILCHTRKPRRAKGRMGPGRPAERDG